MVLSLLPSAEVTVVAWASAQADLAAIHGGRVGTKLAGTLPAIRVTRIGNAPPEPWRDEASVQIECWATTQAAADLLARTFVAALPSIRGYGGQVWAYSISSGPYWAPDDPTLSNSSRYILTVQLLITP